MDLAFTVFYECSDFVYPFLSFFLCFSKKRKPLPPGFQDKEGLGSFSTISCITLL